MRNHISKFASVIALILSVVAQPVVAQGNLSTQGFGYPPGQFSSRVLATGGALAEMDPITPVNPASLSSWGAAALFMQYDPEFRTVTTPGGEARTRTSRIPLIAFGIPVSKRFQTGVSISTLLDRSWAISYETTQNIAGEDADVTTSFQSAGAINDVRLGVSYELLPTLALGVGGHILTGQNKVTERQIFADTLSFQNVTQTNEISYTGNAASVGATWKPGAAFNLAASARFGGSLDAKGGDTVISSAKVPNRYSGSIAYTGINGATIAARVAKEDWTAMDGLGSSLVTTFDAVDVGFGVEATGPRIQSSSMLLRLGVRNRTLPFGANGNKVKEFSFGGGIGASLAKNRASFDIAALKVNRSADNISGTKESAWTLSLGFKVRP